MAKRDIMAVLERLDAKSLDELVSRAGISVTGDVKEALVTYYRKPDGCYDMVRAARDISLLPAVDQRLRAILRLGVSREVSTKSGDASCGR